MNCYRCLKELQACDPINVGLCATCHSKIAVMATPAIASDPVDLYRELVGLRAENARLKGELEKARQSAADWEADAQSRERNVMDSRSDVFHLKQRLGEVVEERDAALAELATLRVKLPGLVHDIWRADADTCLAEPSSPAYAELQALLGPNSKMNSSDESISTIKDKDNANSTP